MLSGILHNVKLKRSSDTLNLSIIACKIGSKTAQDWTNMDGLSVIGSRQYKDDYL